MGKKSYYRSVAFTGLVVSVSSVLTIYSLLTGHPTLEEPHRHHLEVGGNHGDTWRSTYRWDGRGEHGVGRHILAAEDECRGVHSVQGREAKCEFVKSTSDCTNDDGFFQYTYFTYCLVKIVPLAMFVFALWIIFTFIGLAVCADDFFCPALVVISKTLRLTPNVAGVTFLAFGNGAPDFFSALSALGKGDGNTGMGVGGLFGAGMFVTTIVVGSICVLAPFKAMERPFLRDVIFYMGAVYWTFYVLWMQKMRLFEAIGLMVIYPVYVVVVIVSSAVYQRQQDAKANKNNNGAVLKDSSVIHSVSLDNSAGALSGVQNMAYDPADVKDEKPTANGEVVSNGLKIPPPMKRENSMANIGLDGPLDLGILDKEAELQVEEEPEPPLAWWQMILYGINPINLDEWPDMRWFQRAYEVFKSPIMFCIQLTCPVIDYDDEELHNWNKYLQMVQCFTAPVIATLLTKTFNVSVGGGSFKLWMLFLLVGFVFAVIIFFTSHPDRKPVYHSVFGYMGFAVALIWIYVIANEIVSLLETIGVVLNISNAILGLTLLAWGNSIGDWVSNVVMARQGFARMGFAACFGAPLFNLCLGFGIPMCIQIVSKKQDAVMPMTHVNLVLGFFLLFSLVTSLVMLPLLRFKVNRIYGFFLLILYIVFLIIAILTETKVINLNFIYKT